MDVTQFRVGRGCSRFWGEIITAAKLGVLPPTVGGSKWRSELGHRDDTVRSGATFFSLVWPLRVGNLKADNSLFKHTRVREAFYFLPGLQKLDTIIKLARAPHVTCDGIMGAFWQKGELFPCNRCVVWFCMRFLIHYRPSHSTNCGKRIAGVNTYLASFACSFKDHFQRHFKYFKDILVHKI